MQVLQGVDMIGFLADWATLLLRWFHITLGIAWIGASFFFVWLDISFKKRAQMNKGVSGTSWMVHGGGFYHVEKYLVAPEALPSDLHWFKWEAYLTWISGFALLISIYYFNATAYLIDPAVLALVPWQAIAISIGSLLVGWMIYDGLCKSPIGREQILLVPAVFILICGAAYLFTLVFSGRGAFIHVGAFVGTIMAANVFMVIIPNQAKITKALLADLPPDPKLGQIGKQRSLHNNYLTLPVLVMMVSNHHPMLFSHDKSWLIVALILIVGAMVRHFINRHDAGVPAKKILWTLGVAAVALLALIVMTAPKPVDDSVEVLPNEEIFAIVNQHCTVCHSGSPRHEDHDEAPKGIKFNSLAEVIVQKNAVLQQSVNSNAMPLGNGTAMSKAEREALGAWLRAQ